MNMAGSMGQMTIKISGITGNTPVCKKIRFTIQPKDASEFTQEVSISNNNPNQTYEFVGSYSDFMVKKVELLDADDAVIAQWYTDWDLSKGELIHDGIDSVIIDGEPQITYRLSSFVGATGSTPVCTKLKAYRDSTELFSNNVVTSITTAVSSITSGSGTLYIKIYDARDNLIGFKANPSLTQRP